MLNPKRAPEKTLNGTLQRDPKPNLEVTVSEFLNETRTETLNETLNGTHKTRDSDYSFRDRTTILGLGLQGSRAGAQNYQGVVV